MQNLLFFNYDLLQERMNSDISLEEQYVRAYIAYRAGNGLPNRQCFASVETISKDLGISENTARKHIKFLVAAKHIIQLGYRSKYGTKQYVINDNQSEWVSITANFRNAYKNIEGIKANKRKAKSLIYAASAYFDAPSETQNLNPNSLKELDYKNEETQETAYFDFSQEETQEVNNINETPYGDCLEPEDTPPGRVLPPPCPSPDLFRKPIKGGAIDYSELGFEVSNDFGGGIKSFGGEPATPFNAPSFPAPVFSPSSENNDNAGGNTSTWDDDDDALVAEEKTASNDTATSSNFPEPVFTSSSPAIYTNLIDEPCNGDDDWTHDPTTEEQVQIPFVASEEPQTPDIAPARKGKSRFDLTPDPVEEQLEPNEKADLELDLMSNVEELKELIPQNITEEQCKKTSPITQELKLEIMKVLGPDCLKWLDYPYLLLQKLREKKEEARKERQRIQAEIYHQQRQKEQEDAEKAEQVQTQGEAVEPVVLDFVDDWEDAPVLEEPDPNAPPYIPESERPKPVKPSGPPAPGTPEYEAAVMPTLGLDIDNPERVIEFLAQSNIFFNNDRRHYELHVAEEIMDRFVPLFAENLANKLNEPMSFDKFIEFCLTYVCRDLGWEKEDRYQQGTLKKLIEPWVPSKFQAEDYRHFSKEELLNVAFRDNLELCEQCSFNDMMLQHDEIAFAAKAEGMTIEDYLKKIRTEAAKQANEIWQKEDGLIDPADYEL